MKRRGREGGRRRPQRPPLLLLPEKDGEEKKRRKVNKLGGRERASLSSLPLWRAHFAPDFELEAAYEAAEDGREREGVEWE